ncbi:MAG: acyltransferase, partial [Planctomycetota bacterium]|nr:acyltransferase [Planctomycetota bacterium]
MSVRDRPAAFRLEIQGLRGLAVLAVSLFHAGFGWAGGGYAGVDVFFVISGFLIFGIIRRDFQAGRFRLADFYARRVRRLYPAFAAIMLAAVPAAYLILPPALYLVFFKSFQNSLWQAANIYFYRHSGYFDPETIHTPLLHLWSVAVEWQFYLLFPPLCLALFRYGREKAAGILAALTALGLLASSQVFRDQPAAFYLFPFRAWELMFGACLVYAAPFRIPTRVAPFLFLLGLILVLGPVFAYGPLETVFPGPLAAPPCLGAGLLLLSHPACSPRIQGLLRANFLVFTGEISYSLYLLHWPVLVFYRIAVIQEGEPSPAAKLGLLAASYAAAAVLTLAWENRVRAMRARPAAVLAAGVLATGLLWATARIGYSRTKDAMGMRPLTEAPKGRSLGIEVTVDGEKRTAYLTVFGADKGKEGGPDFLLVGNSHAPPFVAALDQPAADLGLTGILVTGGAFMLGTDYPDDRLERVKLLQEAQREAIRTFQIREVMVIARWPEAVTGDQPRTRQASRPFASEPFMAGLKKMRDEFLALGVEKIWVNLPWPVQRLDLTLYNRSDDPNRYAIDAEDYFRRHGGAETALKTVFPSRFLDFPSVLLAKSPLPGRFPLCLGEEALYVDEDHPSPAGARLMTELFRPPLQDL